MDLMVRGPGSVTDLLTGETRSRADLSAEILRRAAVLASLDVEPGSRVVIAHGGTPSFFADLFAVWHLGASAVCANPSLTPDEFENITSFAGARVVLDGEAANPGLSRVGLPVLCLSREKAHGDAPPGAGAPDDEALILFTSGTTGEPKGVVHTFASLQARIGLNRQHIGDETLTRSLCVLPTYFGHGLIGNCLTPLAAGQDLLLATSMDMRRISVLGSTLDEHRISFMSSVPSFWKIALKVSRPPKNDSLRRIQIGSAPLSADLWRSVMDWSGGATVANLYGITEVANWAAGAPSAEFEPADGLVGTVWGGEAAVMDAGGSRLRQGEGELLLKTPSVMAGYLGRPDLTQRVLRDGWFHTGDTGHIDKNGVIRLTGRQKTEINRAGIKIQPEEIDLLLERHDEVVEACTFGVPDEVSGEIVGVAVRLRDGSGVDQAALRTWCLEKIRRESVPERWYIVDEIPKNDRGKIDRQKVRESCLVNDRSQ
jgi:acyl-CoA synthetase (AMP-forming)/AMP-acid ligase II